MSNLLDELKGRRSVRKYQARPVPEGLIRKVLEAAGLAPSAHNAQPWRFIVLANPQVKRQLAEAMARAWAADMAKDGVSVEPEKFNLRVERFSDAPALLLACFCMEGMATFADVKRQRLERDLAMQSLAAATENLLLAAHSMGLGACWICAPAFCKETVRQTLKIPSEVEPEALISLGFPAEEPVAPVRKRLGDYCFWERWGDSLV
ncbi:MAG: nitroreductase family protein [Candidatus Bathyarchaeia archaeon]|jgi:F420 biosynthesis protein FbiB-like protein